MISISVDFTTDRYFESVDFNGGVMPEKNKVNQRVLLTKSLTHHALIEILRTHQINKITIRRLCQVAGINRSTFYKYYGSQYDVFNEMAETYIQQTSFKIIEEISAGKNISECLTHILQYIKDHLEFAKLMLEQEHYDLLSNITEAFPQFDEMIIKHLPEKLDLDKKRAIASYAQYGSVRLLKEWILSDCLRPPEEEAELILYMAGRTISSNC